MLPKILFVDDEEKILQGLKRMLRPLSSSYTLLFANGAEEALEKIVTEDISIICTDMKMPEKDGAELLSEVREIAPSTIRLVLSGQAEEHHVLRALPHAHQYLPKPCDANNLREIIENLSSVSGKLPNAKIRQSILRLSAVPSQEDLLKEFISLLNSDKPTVEDLAEIAKMDLGISTKIVHLISSGFLRANTSANSIKEAIKIVGIDVLRRLANDYPIFYFPKSKTSQIVLEKTNELAIMIGISLEEQSRSLSLENPEIHYLKGFSSFIGRAVLCTDYPSPYESYLKQENKETISDFEMKNFGITSVGLSAALSDLWGISKLFDTRNKYHRSLIDLETLIQEREKQVFGNK